MSRSYDDRCKRWLELDRSILTGPEGKRYFKRAARRKARRDSKEVTQAEDPTYYQEVMPELSTPSGAFAYVNGRYCYRGNK